MTDPLTIHPPQALLTAFTTAISQQIQPLSSTALGNRGTKLFGAAIFTKADLALVLADTNQESDSPLWHGETYTIARFFDLPPDRRPAPADCLFLCTHEPCSLCINAIAWAGFDNFTFLWSYEETEELFGVGGDLRVWRECFFACPPPPPPPPPHHGDNNDDDDDDNENQNRPLSSTAESELKNTLSASPSCTVVSGTVKIPSRPHAFYRSTNAVFVATTVARLLDAVPDPDERRTWTDRVAAVARAYGSLSPFYRRRMGIDMGH